MREYGSAGVRECGSAGVRKDESSHPARSGGTLAVL